jgi:hypothetical protein
MELLILVAGQVAQPLMLQLQMLEQLVDQVL